MSRTPHDALFKATFSRPEHAAAALSQALPPELAKHIDFSSLQLMPGSFVDADLAASHTDLLYKALFDGEPFLLYLLYEHQSEPEALMPLRFLRYMVRIWDHHLQSHPGTRRIPAILPVVLHHSARGWTAAVSFHEILDLSPAALELLAAYIPRFRFVLDDISAETDEALLGRAMTALGRLVLWCFRHAREPMELVTRFPLWKGIIQEVRRSAEGGAALGRVWRYIITIANPAQPQEFIRALLEQAGPETEEEIVSVADWLREQGRIEGERTGRIEGERTGRIEGERTGRIEGEREGIRKTLLKQLGVRFGELPEAVIAAIRAAGPEQLERWLERVVTANALNEVLAES